MQFREYLGIFAEGEVNIGEPWILEIPYTRRFEKKDDLRVYREIIT